MNRRKILIIKTGRSEVFNESESSAVCSLGDVLRCSYLSTLFKDDNVTWVTDKKAFTLFKDQTDLISYDEFSKLNLDKFSIIINLEKDVEVMRGIAKCDNSYGFMFRDNELIFSTYPLKKTLVFSSLVSTINSSENQTFQYHLANLLGFKWNHEEYIFNDSKKKNYTATIGLNWKVGSKWPEKALDESIWKELEKSLRMTIQTAVLMETLVELGDRSYRC